MEEAPTGKGDGGSSTREMPHAGKTRWQDGGNRMREMPPAGKTRFRPGDEKWQAGPGGGMKDTTFKSFSTRLVVRIQAAASAAQGFFFLVDLACMLRLCRTIVEIHVGTKL